jgi:hypothetical protein
VLLVGVSLMTAAPSAEQVADLTIQTAVASPATSEPWHQRRLNIIGSVVLAATIGVLWIVFR